jgi:hypothetical protein
VLGWNTIARCHARLHILHRTSPLPNQHPPWIHVPADYISRVTRCVLACRFSWYIIKRSRDDTRAIRAFAGHTFTHSCVVNTKRDSTGSGGRSQPCAKKLS